LPTSKRSLNAGPAARCSATCCHQDVAFEAAQVLTGGSAFSGGVRPAVCEAPAQGAAPCQLYSHVSVAAPAACAERPAECAVHLLAESSGEAVAGVEETVAVGMDGDDTCLGVLFRTESGKVLTDGKRLSTHKKG